MELRQLTTFMSIAKHQSFSNAADELGYAQSTITTQIQLLEQELGVKVFERLGKRIALTAEGQRLLPYAQQILRLSVEAKNAISQSEVPRGTLTIGTAESLCILRLPVLLTEYRKRYPQVEIALKFGGSSDFYRFLHDNTIDVAFFLDQKVDHPDFVTLQATPEPMVLLAPPDHPLTKKTQVVPADLAEETLILTEAGCRYRAAFENILSHEGIRPRSIMETGSVQAIKQLTISGIGITLLPKVAVEDELSEGQLQTLQWSGPEINMMTQVVIHKNKWLSAPLKVFLDLTREMEPFIFNHSG